MDDASEHFRLLVSANLNIRFIVVKATEQKRDATVKGCFIANESSFGVC